MRLMTEHDYEQLLELRDLAHSLQDFHASLTKLVASLTGLRPNDDNVTDLVFNGGSIESFLSNAGLRVVKNGQTIFPTETEGG